MRLWALSVWLWVPMASANDLCAEALWSKFRSFPAMETLIANADHELPFIGPNDEMFEGGPIYTHSVRQLFRRDTVLMELAFTKPGSVDGALLGRQAFRPLIAAHENLRRLTDALAREPILPEAATWRERLRGRPHFARRTDLLWETREALYLVFAYWAVFDRRLRGELEGGPMWTRLRAIDDDVKERAEELFRTALSVERRTAAYAALARILSDWRAHATPRQATPYLLPFERAEYEERADQMRVLDGYERAVLRARAERARRAAFRVIRSGDDSM